MKNRPILILKGISIIGVVSQHLSSPRFSNNLQSSISEVASLTSWCVLAFVLAAGWLHSLGELKRPKSFHEFFLSKTKRLILPFVALNLLGAILWQAVQHLGLQQPGGKMDTSLLGKFLKSLTWEQPVAGQLYFLPLLFVIAVLFHGILKIARHEGAALLSASSLVTAIAFTPHASGTGLSIGLFFYGTFFYGVGYGMNLYKDARARDFVLVLITAIMIWLLGTEGLTKSFPMLLLASLERFGFPHAAFLERLGESSGTIYAYHAPFLIQGLLLGVLALPEKLQFCGVLLAGAATLVICSILYHTLIKTKLKFAAI